MRVAQFLEDQEVEFEEIVHPPAYTSNHRAKYLGISGECVAKSVLLRGPEGFFLAVLPATHFVHTRVIAQELGGPVRFATDEEVGEVFRDCEWGVVTPFGVLYDVPSLLDESLAPSARIVFEGHTHAQAIRMRCGDFERLEHPRRMRFAFRHPEDAR